MAGDVVKVAKGKWKDLHIIAKKGGAEGKPITVRVEVPGETLFTGSTNLEFVAPYVVFDGIFYKGAMEADGKGSALIRFKSHHCVLRNTAIVDYNPLAFQTAYYRVLFEGNSNTLDRCYFKGKTIRSRSSATPSMIAVTTPPSPAILRISLSMSPTAAKSFVSEVREKFEDEETYKGTNPFSY